MGKILLFVALLFATSLMADEVHWAFDFKSGIETATKENKPVLFVFSRHTCKYCKILEQTTLSDKRVITALNKDFVSIISYNDDNDYTPRELFRPATPTIWFLLPNGEPMYQPIMGAIGPNKFLQALGIVKNAFDNSKTVKKIKTKSEKK